MQKQDANILLLDGAMGTILQQNGMSADVCPEAWALEHPDVLKDIYQSYASAGSQVLLTCTFGANRKKLANFSLENEVEHLNTGLVKIAREAAPGSIIAGSIGPTGQMIAPLGELSFDEAAEVFREQALALERGGVDSIAIETMMDLQEARAAVLGVRSACSLPFTVTMTFQNGRTLTGASPESVLITLQALGASAVGCNCGAGPKEMLPPISAMAPYAHVPLIAKPNAGLPELIGQQTRYSLPPAAFAHGALALAQAGARQIGGCCGTTPSHIQALREAVDGLSFLPRSATTQEMLCSARQHVAFMDALMIGNINLQSQPDLLAAAARKEYDAIRDVAENMTQTDLICLTAYADNIDEGKALAGLAQALSCCNQTPLAFHPSSASALEEALRAYPGRALVILDQLNEEHRDHILIMADYYGAVCVV